MGIVEARRGERASGLDSIWLLAAWLPLKLIISWVTAQEEQPGITASSCSETSSQRGAGLGSKAHPVWGSGRSGWGLPSNKQGWASVRTSSPAQCPACPQREPHLALMSSIRSSVTRCFPVDAEAPHPNLTKRKGPVSSCPLVTQEGRGTCALSGSPALSLPLTPVTHLSHQIYNEMIRDLLNPALGYLELREDSKGVIQVAGITEVSTINAKEVSLAQPARAVGTGPDPGEQEGQRTDQAARPPRALHTQRPAHRHLGCLPTWGPQERPPSLPPTQIMQLLMKGNRQRTQEPTAANQTSSRSHAVLQVSVRQRSRVKNILQEVRQGRLFMIDLAGSERASQVRPAALEAGGKLVGGGGRGDVAS